MSALKIATAPAAELLTLAQAKDHLRLESADDDVLITTLIEVVRQQIETEIKRALITQTWDYWIDRFPFEDEIEIPLGQLQSVSTFEQKDEDGTVTAVASTVYDVDTDSDPGKIYLKPSQSWPTATLWPENPIGIRFVAGFGDSASDVPKPIQQAALLMVEHYYTNTSQVIVLAGLTPVDLPRGADALLGPYRLHDF